LSSGQRKTKFYKRRETQKRQAMAFRGMLLQQKFLLGAFILAAVAASQPDPNCDQRCGNLSIPYPFGISEGCYLDPSFLITCDYSSRIPTPFLRKGNITVLNISLDGELRVLSFVARDCYNKPGLSVNRTNSQFTLSKFTVSYTRNKFTVVGCDTYGYISGAVQATSGVLKNYTTGCISLCDKIESVDNGTCSGIGCCQTSIPEGGIDLTAKVRSFDNYSAVFGFNPCGFGFVVEEEAYNFSPLDLTNLQGRVQVPVVLDWAVGNETCEDAKGNMTSYACKAESSYCYNSTNGPGYRCNCSTGFQGNPYLPDGCKGNLNTFRLVSLFILFIFLDFGQV
jgi:hypothetical protein